MTSIQILLCTFEWTGAVQRVTKAESFLISPVKLYTTALGERGSFITGEWQNDKISRKEIWSMV